MELSAVGESVFAAESIIKRRIRRVFFHPHTHTHTRRVSAVRARRARIYNSRPTGAAAPRSAVLLSLVSLSRCSCCCRRCFCAGSLGISGEMERLVSEVSIEASEAAKDSAPSWPLAQLHLRSQAAAFLRSFCFFFCLFVLFYCLGNVFLERESV